MPKNGIKSDRAWLYWLWCSLWSRSSNLRPNLHAICYLLCAFVLHYGKKKFTGRKKKCWKRLWEHKKKKKKTQTFEQLIICKATKKFCVRCSIISCRLRFSVIRRLQSHIRNIAANLMDTLIIFKRLNIWVYMIYNGDYLFVVSLKNRLVSHNKNCCTHFA